VGERTAALAPVKTAWSRLLALRCRVEYETERGPRRIRPSVTDTTIVSDANQNLAEQERHGDTEEETE
jgi:hypothetical protein